MEPEAADRVGFMSKAEILRVIISERLTAAAQEIFAVVERTLAGYEEEVSGCRQEIDLQRNQLGVLLHRPVKVETEDDDYMIPISEPTAEEASEGGGGGDEDVLHTEEEQQQQKFELSVEDDGSMALLCYTGVETHDEEEDEENEEDEEEQEEGARTSSLSSWG
ncbi:hypothetical protein INR49_006906 [Caranx melampygus]|nr:hypothetical protein INR49_006906 [Caranx melampygus]